VETMAKRTGGGRGQDQPDPRYTYSVEVTPENRDRLKQMARREDRTVKGIIARVLVHFLELPEKEQEKILRRSLVDGDSAK
jgi:hypothetical protein